MKLEDGTAMAERQPDDPPGFDTSYEWKAVLLLSLAFGLVGLDRWIIAPLAPAIISDLQLQPEDINLLIAVLGITWGVAAILMGNLSDRWGRRKVLLPAILVFSLASGLSGLASGLFAFALIRGLMGVAEGAFAPASFAATAEASHPKRRGFNQGLQQASFALFGLGFGPIIATQLLEHFSWRGVFMIVAVPGLVLTVFLARVIREQRAATGKISAAASPVESGNQEESVPVLEVLRHRNVPLAMIGLLCAMCGIFVLSANAPLSCER